MMTTVARNAKTAQARDRLVERFRSAGATSYHAAIAPGPLDRTEQTMFDVLKRIDVLRETSPGKWYLREDALRDMRSREMRITVVFMALVAAGVLAGVLMAYLGR